MMKTLLDIPLEDYNFFLDTKIQELNNFLESQKSYSKNNLEFFDEEFTYEINEFLKSSFTVENNDYRSEFLSIDDDYINFYDDDGIFHKNIRGSLLGKLKVLKRFRKNSIRLKSNQAQNQVMKLYSENNKVFIVHGRNEIIKEQVYSTLKDLGLTPIILHQQANTGKTLIEKFETNADVGFAVILLTDDDEGRIKGENSFFPRARQNVIMEMGYFIGKLSRSRVCLLKSKNVETPSDILGIVYEEIDEAGFWRYKLGKELIAAGYSVDLNKIN